MLPFQSELWGCAFSWWNSSLNGLVLMVFCFFLSYAWFSLDGKIISKYSPVFRIFIMLAVIYPIWGRHFRVEVICHFPVLLLISAFFERNLVVICCKLATVNRKYKKCILWNKTGLPIAWEKYMQQAFYIQDNFCEYTLIT